MAPQSQATIRRTTFRRAVEQALALGAHRKLFSYLTLFVEGAGNLSLTTFTASSSAPQTQQPLSLSSPSAKDLELPINVLSERVAFQVSTNQPGACSSCKNLRRVCARIPGSPSAA